jgi:hypothetical protein
MRDLPVRSRPVVGLPSRWALDLGAGGAVLPFVSILGPALLLGGPPPQALWGSLLQLALATGLAGFVLGALAPLVLDKLRGNVPLPLLAWLAATVCCASMLGVTWLVPLPAALALLWVALGAGLGTFLWLPYLMATALRQPTWPVLATGLLGSSAFTALFFLLL